MKTMRENKPVRGEKRFFQILSSCGEASKLKAEKHRASLKKPF